jgi:class 3 adenylate cyclase
VLVFMLINGAASWTREAYDRRAYNLNKLAEREISNTDKLLKQMMPSHVVKNLKRDIALTDKYYEVTILFSDIVGFTNWSSQRTPIEVVSMLSKLFTLFDHCCVDNDVYKVHTIGDAYVILGFSGADAEGQRDYYKEAQNILNMAYNMISTIKKVNKKKNMDLNMRIGIHTGEVIAGISGTNIVRYDIYGSDVSIANKMESEGQPGKINISETARRLIDQYSPGRYSYTENKVVEYSAADMKVMSWFISENS